MKLSIVAILVLASSLIVNSKSISKKSTSKDGYSKLIFALGSTDKGSTDNFVSLKDTEVIDVNDESYPPANCKPVDDYPAETWGAMGTMLGDGTPAVCGGDPNSNDCYTLSQGKWSKMASLKEKRRSAGSVYVPNVGWWILGGQYSGSTSEIYDENQQKWTAGPTLPEDLKWQCVMMISDTKVLMSGGNDNKKIVQKSWIYDWSDSDPQWTEMAMMTTPRFAHTCIWDDLEGIVIVSGGYDGDYLDSSEIYNPETNEWTYGGPTLPRAMDSMTIAQSGDGDYYMAGGFGPDHHTIADVLKYESDVWTTYGYKLKTPRQSFVSFFVPEAALRQC